AAGCAGHCICSLSLASAYRSDISRLSMGLPAARNRIPGDLSRPHAAANLAIPLAAIPSYVSLGDGQAVERRPDLAQTDRASVSLPDAAAAHALRLPPPTPAGFSEGFSRLHVFRRAARAVSLFRAAAHPLFRGVHDDYA